jgi:hypothetical protein
VSGDIRSFVQIVRCKAAPVVMIPPRPNRRWGRGLLGLVMEEVEAALVLVSTLGIEIRVGGMVVEGVSLRRCMIRGKWLLVSRGGGGKGSNLGDS